MNWVRDSGEGSGTSSADERLIRRSDRSAQYLSIRCTERRAEAGIEASMESKSDVYTARSQNR
jgi:hypothetical protein